MRHILVLILALALAAAAGAATPPEPPTNGVPSTPQTLSAPVYVLSGGGYGHGVGLNQYGALGQARRTAPTATSSSFYYPGTTSRKAPVSTVRVLIADGRPSLEIGSSAPFIRHATRPARSRRSRRERSSSSQI